MKEVLVPIESSKCTKHNAKIYVSCILILLLSLEWKCTAADPETAKGLLADNVDHRHGTSQEALKTQKKQYLLKGKGSHIKDDLKEKISKQNKSQANALKHQKLLNAIEENSLPRIANSPIRQISPPKSAIERILEERNNRIKNKLSSDLASRNINFLNERARPSPAPAKFASFNQQNQNGVFGTGNKAKSPSSLHPDTIGRISYRGRNGQPSRAFGKFLKNHNNYQQPTWGEFSPPINEQLPQYQSNQMYGMVRGIPQPQFDQKQVYGLPNTVYQSNFGSNQGPVPRNWNENSNSIQNPGKPGANSNSHKWPVQPNSDDFLESISKENVKASDVPKGNQAKDTNLKVNNEANNMKTKPSQTKEASTLSQGPATKATYLGKKTQGINPSDIGQNLNQVTEDNKKGNAHIPRQSTTTPFITSKLLATTKLTVGGTSDTPKIEMLRADKKAAYGFESELSDMPRESFSALIIGLTFVGIFIVMAFGLVGHTIYNKLNSNCERDNGRKDHFGRKGRFMRSPNEEDRTPPELRSGCGQTSFVQPDLGNSINGGYCDSRNGGHNGTNGDQNGLHQPFFNGKLILHELNSGLPIHSKYPMNGMSSNMPPSMTNQPNSKFLGLGKPGEHLGAIPKKMPSPAANVQVTDDLISPKYDDKDKNGHQDDSTESEEEDSSDDTVYECPGLAASSGDDIVVANPFFMAGQDLTPLVPTKNSPARKQPQPISQNETLFHQGITGLN